MSATEDESRELDAGWDEGPEEETADEEDVDAAWDSVPVPMSAPSSVPASSAPLSAAAATEEVDDGWGDVPEGAGQPGGGKRRPHRPRRAKGAMVTPAANPVLLPRPAENTKKHQREHARQQRAYEAKVKQQRKAEKKAQRVAEAREQTAARLRQIEAEEHARAEQRSARERERSDRAASAKAKARAKPTASLKKAAGTEARSVERDHEAAPQKVPTKGGLGIGVVLTLLVIAALVALLVLRK